VAHELIAAAKAADLDEAVRGATRDLILVLADTKRLLGMRYADWILGAPELEAGIACASMAQDEWGHGRLLYALLKDFDDDVDLLEHGREPHEYHSMQALDESPQSWPALVVINAFVDTALSVQLEALAESAYVPLRQRVGKLLEEERFHAAHGTAWFRRIARSTDAALRALEDALSTTLPPLLAWFGADDGAGATLRAAGIVTAHGSELRARFLDRVAPLLELAGEARRITAIEPDLAGFDDVRRRSGGGGPDAATIAQVRGDKNRAFRMD
jgi:ring-1,2-phenylacetyl-CoA epoxidase subunit PaaC